MGKVTVVLCSEDETVEIGKARVVAYSSTPLGEIDEVELRDFDFTKDEIVQAQVEALQGDVEFYRERFESAVKMRKLEQATAAEARELHTQNLNEVREKYKKKLANLQQNFEEQSAGQEKAKQARRGAKKAEALADAVRSRNKELQKEVASLQDQLEEARVTRGKFQSDAEYWHEKYLETEAALKAFQESWKILDEKNLSLIFEREGLRNENKRLVNDYNRLNDDINCFMEDFSEGATAINRAVEDWNATVPE